MSLKIGDTVRWYDSEQPTIAGLAIPAYRNARGVVVAISPSGRVRIHWQGDRSPEGVYRVVTAPRVDNNPNSTTPVCKADDL